MARAFIIRPFNTKTDSSGRTIDFERVDRDLITPAIQAMALGGSTTGEIVEAGNIRADMFALILEADVVICDITVHNANVFYELGIRHALRKKHTVLIRGTPTADGTPFDLLTDRYLEYPIDSPGDALERLTQAIRHGLVSERETDSPIFQMLPKLRQADPAEVRVLPLDFIEEVQRAEVSGASGWLRLLADEVRTERFQWDGMRLVGHAQWRVEDYKGARDSFEALRANAPADVDANLALANIYERLSRRGDSALLETSNQAIRRVLEGQPGRKQKAEALGLKGRNSKTQWRERVERLVSVEERRTAALSRGLIDTYEAYRGAFEEDFNNFYPGVAALQAGTILLELASPPLWSDLFDNERKARDYRAGLVEQTESLRHVVAASAAADIRSRPSGDPEAIWARIAQADLLFLGKGAAAGRVSKAYDDALLGASRFARMSALAQLKLFADLGIRADIATRVIEAQRPAAAPAGEAPKPVHLVVFTGHAIDLPGRAQPRFPPEREAEFRARIRQSLEGLQDSEHQVEVLASGAPGADILAHEVCKDLGLRSTMCLPMPAAAVAGSAFKGLPAWQSRFLDLVEVHEAEKRILVLNNQPGLPRWLQRDGVDAWERGNRWVVNLALTWAARRRTLVALWDGKDSGDGPGGTAHMVRLTQQTGEIRLQTIDVAPAAAA